MDVPALRRGLEYLSSEQQPDGSFISYSSPRLTPFTGAISYHTTFVPSLILHALCAVPGTRAQRAKLCRWLLAQKSDLGSFNYWAKDAPEQTTLPYPDDLDDTFLALSSLWLYDPNTLTASDLARTVKLLIATEVRVGGPYRTWLVPKDSNPVWADVDLAVNSNIAYFLQLVAQPLPALTELMEAAITDRRYTSPYYPSPYPVLYFIARAYKGPKKDTLAAFIASLAKDGHWDTPLHTALALNALRALHVTTHRESAVQYLLHAQQPDGSWPAEAFCIDPAKKGAQYYHGAAALTTALALSALQPPRLPMPAATVLRRAKSRLSANIITVAQKEGKRQPAAFASQYAAVLARIQQLDNIDEIILLPKLFAESLVMPGAFLPASTHIHLGAATLYGWMAYTVFDDFLDDEGSAAQLPVAAFSLRRALRHFHLALPYNAAYAQVVESAFDVIDAANAWELTHCRFAIEKGRLVVGTPPPYTDPLALADRSLGHTLAPLGILALYGIAPGSRAAKNIHQALRHYIAARQLNDDAHDWQEDVQKGHISYVVAQLLSVVGANAGQRRNLHALLPAMQRQFWHVAVRTICTDILTQTAAARSTAAASGAVKPKNFITKLCDAIDASVERTLKEQAEAIEFLNAYRKK